MKLYTYWRSSASYRVRIALALKGIGYDSAYVHMVRDGGEHLKDAYAKVNPQRQVPALELDDGTILTQSLAIIEYLEDTHPQVPLLPSDALGKARVRALSHIVACDIHPINNLRVLKHLTGELGVDDKQKMAWYAKWIENGFATIEHLLATSETTGEFCHGDVPTLADVCLVPQVYNARRFNVDMTPYPKIVRIDENCRALEAFAAAAPEAQGDAKA